MFVKVRDLIFKSKKMISKQFQMTAKGRVLEDSIIKKNYNNKPKEDRELRVFQKGSTELLRVKLPLDYKRDKPNVDGEEVFNGTFYFYFNNGKIDGVLTVKEK